MSKNQKKPKILIVYTGGTIGMVKDYKTGALKAFDFSQISSKIPELQQLHCEMTTISFDQAIDSSNMNVSYYTDIAQIIADNYDKFDGFVVLTGSDTMSYTSSAISFMFENLQKPVIFTGSQLPIGDLRTDAKENLITSIQIASTYKNGKPVIQEVGLYFEYKLYRANRTTKINAEQFEAFASMNYPPLAVSGVHLNFNDSVLFKPKAAENKLIFRKKLDHNVAILKLFPGITAAVVKSFINIPDLKGIVLETYGSGNAPTQKWFINLIEKAISKGIHIVNVTQCAGGSVILGHYETSSDLKRIGIIDGKDITTETAIAKMMYLLGEKLSKEEFKHYFETSLRGEIN
ncbi:asparaginase [Tenacibaculum finnmarkense genomovar finnmarkense]|uniref:asparaginase n=1 Tax=Tenacibaculum finnmarkense genomovar finnmarkense TaxID=1458503 RepID=A0AAP1WGL1_9FLAO|nr:asparaginase [Tenacibaculum finnmarkense]MBE7653119.1 type I asparaginase [Tenacibaculum finnmarkense genomovar finnmarkense]MBE7660139.1 type I asparaginase [Tenacibaculum finnmarkense genomovar finnmarkense]MBE7692925.1 type I asparaginase [Tenacibaculum finnmarkense genomovar finnmarkense]MBE7695511.1 type I asparaginase [Tenacibaculum finnmarkense genomovar finnmarkense]MCD8403110.1 asparaginase [Tenacibaculum finnmarkense genomovar finnmarkense]